MQIKRSSNGKRKPPSNEERKPGIKPERKPETNVSACQTRGARARLVESKKRETRSSGAGGGFSADVPTVDPDPVNSEGK